jgi:hypothetical protein
MDLLGLSREKSPMPSRSSRRHLGMLLDPPGSSNSGPSRDPWQLSPHAGDGESTEAVRGVSLELFAAIADAIASRTKAHGSDIAAARGIAPYDWLIASQTWNARLASDPVKDSAFASRRASKRQAS